MELGLELEMGFGRSGTEKVWGWGAGRKLLGGIRVGIGIGVEESWG